MRTLLFIFLVLLAMRVDAQYKRQPQPIFPRHPQYLKSYYTFAPALTYTAPWITDNQVLKPVGFDTLTETNLTQIGRMFFGASVGKYHILERVYVLKYLEYGLSYAGFKYRERFEENLLAGTSSTLLSIGENNGAWHQVSAYFQVSGIKQFSDKFYWHYGAHLDFGYHFIQNFTSSANALATDWLQPNVLRSSLSLNTGLGIKINSELVVVPVIQVPVWVLYPADGFRFDFTSFSSQYWPLQLRLQFLMFSKPKPEKCPPVKSIGLPDGMMPE